MSRYNYGTGSGTGSGNNFYDPVGSQQNQPTGYTYGTSTSSASSYPSAATSTYASNANNTAYSTYGNQYGSQQPQQQTTYGSTAQAPTGSTTNRAAAALNSLSGQDYQQQPSTATHNSGTGNTAYDGSSWGNAAYGNSYGSNNLQMPNRTQGTRSPLYATQASSTTFGRLGGPERTQSSSNTYGSQSYPDAPRQTTATPSTQSYQSAYTQPPQTQATQPQRYNSPLHAVQAQSHSKQASRSSNHQPSPRMQAVQHAGNRQQSASVEPSPTTMTVNPSQVYDDRAERQRKAQIEAEKRRKREEQEAARKAEEDRVAAQKRKEEEEKQKAEAEAAMRKAEADRKTEQKKKARAEKRQSKNAATALQKMASSGGPNTEEGPPLNAEEAEMRAMFQKMREFNAKNPAMLAKLWEEERRTHSSPPQPTKAAPVPAAPAPTASGSKTGNAAVSSSSSTGARPFQEPPQPKAQKPAVTPATPTIHAQASTSLWPPQKKGTLAEAAAKWLMNLPENAAKRMTRNEIRQGDILNILEKNPSYVQLCEALESRGLRFERSSLARELLRAVPDGMKAQVGQNPPPPAAAGPLSAVNGAASQVNGSSNAPKKRGRPKKDVAAQNSTTVSYETPNFTSLSDAAKEIYAPQVPLGGPVQSPPQQAPRPPSVVEQTPAINGIWAPSPSQPPDTKPEAKPEEPRRPPANKEEAARKRTFGDLVDLTGGDDSDDDGPPKKMAFPTVPSTAGPPGQLPSPATGPGNFGFNKPMNANDFYKRPQPVNQGQGGIHPSVPWGKGPAQLNHPPSSVGQTPQPQTAPQPVKPRGPSAESVQQDRVRGKMLVEPIMRDRVARKSTYDPRTIARDVLLATGRHPDMRPLNSHMNTVAKLLGDHGGFFEMDGMKGNRADLSTVRWDVVDPVPPAAAKVERKKLGGGVGVEFDGDETEDADDEGEVVAAPPARVVMQAVDNGDGTVSHVPVHDQIHGKPKIKARRGRKPRSSMPDGQIAALAGGAHDTNTPHRQVPTQQRAPASAPTAGGGGATVGYAAFRKVDDNGNVVKKQGRPFGWRKSVHSYEAQGLTAVKPASHSGPSKSKQGKGAFVKPRYQVWKCGWQGCEAELHNLDALKKHVVKIHGTPNAEREFECLWEGCKVGRAGKGKGKGRATASDEDENEGEPPVATFPDMQRWVGHVNQAHLQAVAWELGDGPRGGVSDYNHATDSEAYLSDAQGRSVTPIIVPAFDDDDDPQHQEGPSSSRTLPHALPRRPASITANARMTKDERKAAAELEELTQHKRTVGFGMEKGGATFANGKRRRGFLDDEDFEEEVGSEGVRASESEPDGEEEDE